jgi:exopolysaccharide biosynthesis polyprenyl glycosylphosphotransferase
MLAQRNEINLQLLKVCDAALLGLTFWFAHFLRYHRLIVLDRIVEIEAFPSFIWILAVILPFAPFFLEAQGFYNHPQEKTTWRSMQKITMAGIWLFVLLGAAVIFLRLEVPSRSVLILFALFAPCVLMLREQMEIANYQRRVRAGKVGERVILAGEPECIDSLMACLSPVQKMELLVADRIDLTSQSIDDFTSSLHKHSVGRVILAFKNLDMGKAQRAIEACEAEGVDAWLSTEFIPTSIAKPTFSILGPRSMLVFRSKPAAQWSLFFKNIIDRAGAFAGLILLAPLLLLVAALIKMTSPGPALFRQRRAGLHGEPFEMWKFRTMREDAEQQKAELQAFNEMKGPVFKMQDDPRVTPLGRFLRRTSFDEFPQLVNVLRGQMSLVGPRPLPIYEVEKFEETIHRRRLSMKPGLTCLWQIRGRNTVVNFSDWVRMDLEYIDNWSLFLDAYIILRTIPSVLLGIGAR